MKINILLITLITSCRFCFSQYSGKYGSVNYQGSRTNTHSSVAVSHKYVDSASIGSSTNHQSMKYQSGSHHSMNYQSGSHHSMKYQSGSHHSMKYQSGSHHSMKYQSGSNGSGSKGSGSNGSGSKGSAKIHGSGSYPNIFLPTPTPTEEMPPIYQLPPPTYYPTKSTNVPKIKLSFEEPTGFAAPNIPLTFQIQQGGSGKQNKKQNKIVDRLLTSGRKALSVSVLKTSVSKLTGISESAITDIHITHIIRYINASYIITATPISVGEKTQHTAYNKIINLLQSKNLTNTIQSVSNHTMTMNIEHFYASPYIVLSPTALPTGKTVSVIDSINQHEQPKSSAVLYYYMGGVFALIFGCVSYYVYTTRKNNQTNKAEQVNKTLDEPTLSPMENRANIIGIDVIPKRISINN